MKRGHHVTLLTERLKDELDRIAKNTAEPVTVHLTSDGELDSASQRELFVRHVNALVGIALGERKASAVSARLVGTIIDALTRCEESGIDSGDHLVEPLTRFDGLTGPNETLAALPSLSVQSGQLLANSRGEPSLDAVLRSELPSTDSIDLICAFLKWSGLRLLTEDLAPWLAQGRRLRVLTTTYLGATDPGAVEWLVDHGAEVQISTDAESTRLHAKAWLFRRNGGLSTALIGSSNLSRPALVDGLEWNVRLAERQNPDIVKRFTALFESYWEGHEFAVVPPLDQNGQLPGLRAALAVAQGRGGRDDVRIRLIRAIATLEVRAQPHQALILDALEHARAVRDRHRNLVVAATGTGKTVIAALDYRNLCRGRERDRPSLLFVAHRQEILDQALETFRTVLGDANFGERQGGKAIRIRSHDHGRHVFASIQSLHASALANLHPKYFEVLVVDEFHHAEAPTYRRLLDHFAPTELLGLTATPERSDGRSVLERFGGEPTTELRLWTAIEDGLLVPFHYFAIHDNVALDAVRWTRGGYDLGALDRLYTGNDARTRIVLDAIRHHIEAPDDMRTLGFCVSVAHARYMATQFERAGIRSVALTGEDDDVSRRAARDGVARGDIRCLFTVDLFNEGVDIPEIDTLLLLRPTDSATLFQQQLGRGLRRHPDKAVLTVLDFVGEPARIFSFARRWHGTFGQSASDIRRAVGRNFPHLPSGCAVRLDRVSHELVLKNLKEQLRSWRAWAADLAGRGPKTRLGDWLDDVGLSLEDFYSLAGSERSWTRLQRDAGLIDATEVDCERATRVSRLLHVDDLTRLTAMQDVSYGVQGEPPQSNTPAGLVHYQLAAGVATKTTRQLPAMADGLGAYRVGSAANDELAEVAKVLSGRAVRGCTTISPDLPYVLHAAYQRPEILVGMESDATLDSNRWRRIVNHREGIYWCEGRQTDLFLVTVQKDDDSFTESTRYRDFAISDRHFHVESQSRVTRQSPTGQRFLTQSSGSSQIILFARRSRKNAYGLAEPFRCLGFADIVSTEGERPIAMELKLRAPMTEAIREDLTLVL